MTGGFAANYIPARADSIPGWFSQDSFNCLQNYRPRPGRVDNICFRRFGRRATWTYPSRAGDILIFSEAPQVGKAHFRPYTPPERNDR